MDAELESHLGLLEKSTADYFGLTTRKARRRTSSFPPGPRTRTSIM